MAKALPDSNTTDDSTRPPFRLWMVAVSGGIVGLFTYGIMRSNGVLFVEIMKVEQQGRGVASLPFAFHGAAGIFVAPITGFLGSRYTFRRLACLAMVLNLTGFVFCSFSSNVFVLTVSFGIIAASGHQILRILIPPVINTSFKEYRTTAMGIATAGLPIAGFMWPFLTQYFLNEYGLSGTFLLTGAVSLHAITGIVIISFREAENKELIVTSSKEEPLQDHETSKDIGKGKSLNSTLTETTIVDSKLVTVHSNLKGNGEFEEDVAVKPVGFSRTLVNVLTTPELYLLSFSRGFNGWSFQSVNQLTIDYLGDKGIPETSAIFMLTMFSAGGLLGRLCLGWITDKGYLTKEMMTVVTMVVIASVTALMTITNNYSLLLTCGLVLGMCQGSAMVMNWVQYGQYFGNDEMLLAMSLGRIIPGFMVLARAPAVGLFRDFLQSYDYYFLFTSLMVYLLALTWFIVYKRSLYQYELVATKEPKEI